VHSVGTGCSLKISFQWGSAEYGVFVHSVAFLIVTVEKSRHLTSGLPVMRAVMK
jgi:hypothetical protein